MECKVLKKSVTQRPLGGSIWALETQYVQNRPSRWPLSSPPPPRVGYAFLQYFTLQGCSRNSPVWATVAQNGQKVLKKGVPPVLTSFFSKIPGSQTMLSPIFEKKWGIFPRWTIRRGGGALFYGIRREGSLGVRDLPRTVFFRGAPLYNAP